MHERHVKLMREMDENYKLIEKETQEYYIEFLQKWKEVAKSKISQYRKAIDQLCQEKEQIQRAKDQVIDNLNERQTQLLKEKEQILIQYSNDVQAREDERRDFEEQVRKMERERQELKAKASAKDEEIFRLNQEVGQLKGEISQREEQQEQEQLNLRRDFEYRLNDYEDALNKKSEENKALSASVNALTDKLAHLNLQL